jgi:nitrogen fixation protein FixH
MTDATAAAGGAPLSGAKVLAILLTFFGVIFAVNGVMMFDAISTFSGQTNDHPYEVGLKYNTQIAAAAAQNGRRWNVETTLSDGVRVTFRDADGQLLAGLTVSGVYAAPAAVKRDRAFAMTEVSPGVYSGPAAPAGMWDLRLVAQRDDAIVFQSESRLTLDVPALAAVNNEHWRVGVTVAGHDAFATFRDSDGQPVAGLAVSGQFAAPKADHARDRAFAAAETRPGVYAIDPAAVAAGDWDLELVAKRGDETPFQSRNGVIVR